MMKTAIRFLSACYRDTPPSYRRAIAGLALLLLSFAVLLAAQGCAHTERGLSGEQAVYRAGTNVVANVQSFVPYLPPPVASTAEVVLGLATAALAAWNTHQQRQLKLLKNGHGGGNASAAPAPSASTASGSPPSGSL